MVRAAVRTDVRAAVRFSWPNVLNEQSHTQSRLRSAKKAKLMTQVRFAECIEVRIEVRTEVSFEARGLKLTSLVMQQLQQITLNLHYV